VAKAELNKKDLFTNKLDLHMRKDLVKCWSLSTIQSLGFVWCWDLDTSESRQEMPGKFWNGTLEKDGEDSWTHRVRMKY